MHKAVYRGHNCAVSVRGKSNKNGTCLHKCRYAKQYLTILYKSLSPWRKLPRFFTIRYHFTKKSVLDSLVKSEKAKVNAIVLRTVKSSRRSDEIFG